MSAAYTAVAKKMNTTVKTKVKDAAETILTVLRGFSANEKPKPFVGSRDSDRDRTTKLAIISHKLNDATVLKKKNQWATQITIKAENKVKAMPQYPFSRAR